LKDPPNFSSEKFGGFFYAPRGLFLQRIFPQRLQLSADEWARKNFWCTPPPKFERGKEQKV